MKRRISIELKGHSQGMGLRPEVYRLATRHELTGWIKNILSGVFIELQGDEDKINQMLQSFSRWYLDLTHSEPSFEKMEIPPIEETDFRILPSEHSSSSFEQDIPKDTRICPKCMNEIMNPFDRRKDYIFNTCTACGPRYSYFAGFPLDRIGTSWKKFPPCGTCGEEYINPENRRFHAQNISCPDCGPELHISDGNYKNSRALKKAAEYLKKGGIAAVKSTGGVHLVCSAEINDAVLALRKIKGRYKKPFAVMYPDLEEIEKRFSAISNSEKDLLLSKSGPIVVLKGNDPALGESVSEGIGFTGCFLPYNGIYLLLIRETKFPLVITSANRSDEPLAGNMKDIEDLISSCDILMLDHDMKIENTIDDSVMRDADGIAIHIRNGRGCAPIYMMRKNGGRRSGVFCAGADLKNTFALRGDDRIIISPHLGNIEPGNSFENYKNTLERFLSIHDFRIETAVCDMHPGYHTAGFAERLGVNTVKVQHHHAHCMSLMTENEISEDGELFCAAFDGTGYGIDKNIWGGEFLLSSFTSFERAGHLRYFRMPGGDRSAKDGFRTALYILFEMYGENAFKHCPFDPKVIGDNKFLSLENMYQLWKNDESPLCSSAGRIFDAAASIIGLLHRSDYEGQAGLMLESLYRKDKYDPYPFRYEKGIFDWSEIFEGLLQEKDYVLGASRFIDSIASMVIRAAEPFGIFGITGGVFQNAALVSRIKELAENKKLRYLTHKSLPPNDGNISAGQSAYMIGD